MKMIGSTEGDLQLGVFSKKGQKSKYFGKGSTHIPVTLCTIPSEVLNRLEKFISQKTSLHSEGVEKPKPDHANALRKAGFSPSFIPKMGE